MIITEISVSSADLLDAGGPAFGLRGAFPLRSETGIRISLQRGKENEGRAEGDDQHRHQQQRPRVARKIGIPSRPIHHANPQWLTKTQRNRYLSLAKHDSDGRHFHDQASRISPQPRRRDWPTAHDSRTRGPAAPVRDWCKTTRTGTPQG